MRPKQIALAALLVVAVLGCDKVKSLNRAQTDPIVGTWREVSEKPDEPGTATAGTITFDGDGTFRFKLGKIDPAIGGDSADMMKAMEKVPARYRRSADVLVLSLDGYAFKKTLQAFSKVRVDTSPGAVENFGEVLPYKLSGDVLEITRDDKTQRYVRIR